MAADYQQYDYIEKRLRYFDGQFLKDQDFIDEQKYHIDRQRRPLRQLHVSGIVEGLTVEQGSLENPDERSRATVMPGTAIDRQGRQLVLGSPLNVALETFVNPFSNQLLEVHISYQENASDLAAQDNESHRRWHEQPLITVIKMDESGEDIPENGIRLGVVSLDDKGQVTVNRDAVRQYAGIHLPSPSDNPSEQGLTLRSTGFNGLHEATLTGKLTVAGGLDVLGTVFVNEGLNVSGTLSVNENLNVSGALSVTENLDVSGTLSATRVGVGTQTPAAALTVQTLESYSGNTIRFEAAAEPSLYFLNLNTEVSDGVVRWVFNQKNNATSHDAVLAIDRGNIGIGTSTPTARLEISGTDGNLLSVGASSGSMGNVDLCGHVQLREYSDQGMAFLQARDDSSNRDIGLRLRTQIKGFGQRALVDALTIEPSGKIISSMWQATELYNNEIFNGNISTNFTSGGGTLIVMASGSGYGNRGGSLIGMAIAVDANIFGYATTWTNEVNSHKSFVTNFCVVKNITPGSHNLSLTPLPGTVIDANDRCSVTILEVPF